MDLSEDLKLYSYENISTTTMSQSIFNTFLVKVKVRFSLLFWAEGFSLLCDIIKLLLGWIKHSGLLWHDYFSTFLRAAKPLQFYISKRAYKSIHIPGEKKSSWNFMVQKIWMEKKGHRNVKSLPDFNKKYCLQWIYG